MPQRLDLVGEKFGKLTVIAFAGVKKYDNGNMYSQWLCQCDCGNTFTTLGVTLKYGSVKSCGCLKKESAQERARRKIKTDVHAEKLYNVWQGMKARCYNINGIAYNCYGGRGITVCDEWKDNYPAFKKWAYENGYDEDAPKGACTLDRIDVDGNYCPENCRWVDRKAQANNRRTNRLVEYNGETKTLHEWSIITGISQSVLYARIFNLKWDIERAFKQPLSYVSQPKPERKDSRFKLIEYDGEVKTIKEWAEIAGIKPDTLVRRLSKSHWSVEKALTTPVQN